MLGLRPQRLQIQRKYFTDSCYLTCYHASILQFRYKYFLGTSIHTVDSTAISKSEKSTKAQLCHSIDIEINYQEGFLKDDNQLLQTSTTRLLIHLSDRQHPFVLHQLAQSICIYKALYNCRKFDKVFLPQSFLVSGNIRMAEILLPELYMKPQSLSAKTNSLPQSHPEDLY